ncbi:MULTISPECIES: hypothetical protein [unclassified Kribbella]|uniref:hypothetical protein n=1 Tax=unclassified Kribbella TaxID=2644121 RepID=UPI0033DA5F6A
MVKARRSRPVRRRTARRVVVAAVVLGLAGGGALAVQLAGRDSGTAGRDAQGVSTGVRATEVPSQAAETGPPTPAGTAAELSPSAALAACAGSLTAGDPVLSAARIGVDHWSQHVQARTDLLAGLQTEAVTRAIWKRTRLAGPGDQQQYAAALSAWNPHSSKCAGLEPTTENTRFRAAAAACQTRAAVVTRAIAASRPAMTDWQTHLANMTRHAAGEMTAEHAQHLWEESWRTAPAHISAYRAAMGDVAKAPACAPTE